MKSEIQLEVDGGVLTDLAVGRLELEEGLSRPYRAVVTAFSGTARSPKKLREDALGRRVTVKVVQAVEDEGTVTRYLNGVITSAAHLGAKIPNEALASFCGTDKRRISTFRLVIEPHLSALAFTRRTLDYPDTTPLGVVKTVLKRNRIDFTAEGQYLESEDYSGKIRFVQRDETDLKFLERVMSRYGISYTFTHKAGGPEQLVLSDGNDYPPLSPLEFAGDAGYEDARELAFSTEKTKGLFSLTTFCAESRLGFEGLKEGFVRPVQTKAVEHEEGDTGSARVWLRNEAPAGYGEDIDEQTVERDLERFSKATNAALRLATDAWHGETPHVAAMPGRVLKITGFVGGEDGEDEAIKARVTHATLTADLLKTNDDVFRVNFEAMDFSDDLKDKRWVPEQTPAPAREQVLLEAVVCDRSGKFDDARTLNTIATSPHATPETPWIFLVKNPNPGSEDDVNQVIDVAMTMPLGGKRAGLYRFPRVGERVFVMLTGDRAVLMGYVPDRTGSFGDFPENGDKWARQSTALRFTPPTEEKKADGNYSEVGFSYEPDIVAAVEQRIIDGSIAELLETRAIELNNVEGYNAVGNYFLPQAETLRENYFADLKKETADAIHDFAEQIVKQFGFKAAQTGDGIALHLRSTGGIIANANGDVEISAKGAIRLNAPEILLNGRRQITLQSMGKVQSAVGVSSSTVNQSGIVLRSMRVLDANTEYDSSVVVDAADGVAVSGGNVRMNGLFAVSMADALGGTLTTANGELLGSGAIVDLSTAKRDNLTSAYEKLSETSGLDRINEVLSNWQAGKTPDGSPRQIADRRVGCYGLTEQGTKRGVVPYGNYRGTASALTYSSADKMDANVWAGGDAEGAVQPFDGVPSPANRQLTVSNRELLRAQVFSDQLDTHCQTAETILNSVVDGKSSSVTIHGDSLDLNVQNLNNAAENINNDAGSGGGAAG